MKESPFSKLSDDILLNILLKLEDDPRIWARLACVSTKFSSLIGTFCCRSHCLSIIPSVVTDLSLPSSAQPPGGWAALHKIAVCCPGLLQAGVFLENSDFGLERELGPDDIYHRSTPTASSSTSAAVADSNLGNPSCSSSNQNNDYHESVASDDLCWSLYDDLYFDTVYDNSDSHDCDDAPPDFAAHADADVEAEADETMTATATETEDSVGEGSFGINKKRKISRPMRSHLASGAWSLSREQGNKLLANRFRGDTLYICDWPGCVHMEEKRNYMVFRGIFKNFKRSGVWRTINDGQRSKIDLNCAFCECKETWDLHSAFCLRRVFGYHEDGEPVVRAYVCENGHVSGAWTDLPLYT